MNEGQVKDLLRRAYERISMLEDQLAKSHEQAVEEIAVVGLSLKFPQVNSLDDLHEFLDKGACGVQESPTDRWDTKAWLGNRGEAGKAYTFAGGYLDGIEYFDHHFFHIPSEEAKHTDPQQRLLMELAVEAIQHAGILLKEIDGTATGVFVGTVNSDFDGLISPMPSEYSPTGSLVASAAGKVAYKLNLKGPVMSLDTACSSSLVAIHMARQSLLNHECDFALAGGVTLMLTPKGHIGFSQLGAMAMHGRCKTFSNDATGFGRGEGAGFVLLRRASDARRDGNRILGILKGSAINHDGQSNGYTAPNQTAQEAVIVQALQVAGLRPLDIGYIETHGTGTSLGDAIELQALDHVFQYASEVQLGSIKANFGHTEYAAGIASMARAILCLRNKRIYPQIGIEALNANFHWSKSSLKVNQGHSFEKADLNHVGVSGFGISGTNVHQVLGRDQEARTPEAPVQDAPLALYCSARTRNALMALLDRHLSYMEEMDASLIPSYLLANARFRDHFEYRTVVAGWDKDSLLDGIRSQIQEYRETPPIMSPEAEGKVVFLFPGQGGQWAGMGKNLYNRSPQFRATIDEISKAFEPLIGISLAEHLVDASEILLSNERYIQPVLFALQASLAKLWMHYGYMPDAVVGISIGEISAAYVAGSLSLDDAARIIILRSQYLLENASGIQFCLIESGSEELKALRLAFPNIEVAGVYSETSYLIASDADTLDLVQKRMDDLGLYCRRAETTVASHCSHVDPFLDRFGKDIEDTQFQATPCRMYSTAYGRWLSAADFQSTYWKDNLRQPFQFDQAKKELPQKGHSIFLEISLHPLTSYYLTADARSEDPIYQSSLFRGSDSWDSFAQSLRSLYQKGVDPRFGAASSSFIDLLPLYPWDRKFFEIPYGNYGHPGVGSTVSQEYMIPEWKLVPQSGSHPRELGEIHFTAIQEPCLFDQALYRDPADVIQAIGRDPVPKRTIILDMHATEDAAGIERVVNFTRDLLQVGQGRMDLVFLVSNSIRISGAEKTINELGYGWLGFAKSLKAEWNMGEVIWADTDSDNHQELLEFLGGDPSYDHFCIRYSRKYKWHIRSESLYGGARQSPGSALIIGGTSEMGLIMAREYVRLGARQLVLHGRRPVQGEDAMVLHERDKQLRAEIDHWKAEGIQVLLTSGDIGQADTVDALRKELVEHSVRIDDLVLAAGTSAYFNPEDHDGSDFVRQIDLRTFGWRSLAERMAPRRIILISSASSMFQSPGQASYMFSNHVLDSWATSASARGTEALAILFPIWKDFGKAKEMGFLPETLLEHASGHDLVQHFRHLIGVVDPPAVVIAASLADNSTKSLWKEVPFIPEGKLKHRIDEMLAEAAQGQGQGGGRMEGDATSRFIGELWSEFLGEKEWMKHHHFFQLGGNSILLVKISNRIKERFPGIDITVRDLIQNLKFQDQIELVRSRLAAPVKATEHEFTPVEPREMYLASEEQKQIWIQNQLDEHNSLYNLTGAYTYTGYLDVPAFTKAIQHLSQEQEIFRTRYILDNGALYQKIDDRPDLEVRDFVVRSAEELETAVRERFDLESNYGFDLENEHSFRVSLIRSEGQGAFILNLHHIAADGWALGYYTRRLKEIYAVFLQGKEPQKVSLDIQYKDYSVYQQERYLPGDGAVDEAFWMELTRAQVAENYLFPDRQRPATYTYRGEKFTTQLDPSLFGKLLPVKNSAQVSLYAMLQGSLSLLLSIRSGKRNIVTGSPFSSRMDKRLEVVVGNFVNLLPIHLTIVEEETVKGYLSSVQSHLSKVMQHQAYPFNLIVQKSGFRRDPSRHPIFDILFVLQNHEEAKFELEGLEIERKFIDPEHSKLDLFIELREWDGSLQFNFEYNDLIFERQDIEELYRDWERLLEFISRQADPTIADVTRHFQGVASTH